MNLLTHHLEHPSQTFVAARAQAEQSIGRRIVKYFMDVPLDCPTEQIGKLIDGIVGLMNSKATNGVAK